VHEAQNEHNQSGNSAEANCPTPEIIHANDEVGRNNDQKTNRSRDIPGEYPRIERCSPALESCKFGNEAQSDGKIQTNAHTHEEAENEQPDQVGRERAEKSGDNEEKQV